MTLWERCDQIIKLIDEALGQVAFTQTAIPSIAVGPGGGRRPGRQETAPLAEEGSRRLAHAGAAPTAEVASRLAQPDGQASPHERMGYRQSMSERNR
jgi:hypothetical protein